jgi:AcrR family transcriptional regulator
MNDPVMQPRTGNTIRSAKVASRRAKVRGRLLSVAAELFVDRGHSHVSVEELIEAAGISRATFYGFFANKAELAAALLLPVFDSGTALLGNNQEDDPRLLATRLIDLYLQLWSKHRHALLLTGQVDAAVFPLIEQPHREFGTAMLGVLDNIGRAGMLRNGSAELSYRVLAKTGIPLLRLYHDQPEFKKIYSESMYALIFKT